MQFLIDAGNTRIKWAIAGDDARRPGEWLASGIIAHADIATLQRTWQDYKPSHVLVANVAGQPTRLAIEHLLAAQYGKTEVEWFRSASELAGLRNAYRDPAQLGCDRFASAIGACALYPRRALIVATCGTATTVDAITEDGIFLGGMILPGLGLMAKSLAANTAQLPQVGHLIDLASPFADNTHDAIISGCIAAQAGAIERAVAAHAERHGAVQCVLSGGAASMIAPQLSISSETVDNLVLIGLHAAVLFKKALC